MILLAPKSGLGDGWLNSKQNEPTKFKAFSADRLLHLHNPLWLFFLAMLRSVTTNLRRYHRLLGVHRNRDRSMDGLQTTETTMKSKAVISIVLAADIAIGQPSKELIPEICVAVVVVGVGIVVTIGICKMVKKLPPCENPPAPPAPPATNSPSKYSLDGQPINIAIPDDNVGAWDISGFSFSQKDPSGQDYAKLFSFTLRSCTNLTAQWTTELSITGWVSPAYVITVVYQSGQPVQTNLSTRTATNYCNGSFDASSSQRFFELYRGVTP